ncbi:LacI family gluconate utilization system Gnt-I transcriptional repressor [Rubricella aquisinus]|uniref:LacI family gluconate utilization system Gnt-I transcriptional repressor n=1 Tax=Rubricella aquisinus TaxID=2028108 RepID=A0A840WX15_9RHOB|nr:LacI family DNA-binding transcriptional regulator [Rubricella aquisinus]MBB5514236.1 LacI family gluconate utilization system Gnt-I transcriptional repressor [Rubricella aquisinus]
MKRPTLIDVGIEAGVSAITVSRALREPEKVSESLRERIAKAIDKLGYVPNPAASSLASNRSSIIGVLVPSFSNYVFADVLSGANSVIEKTGYSIQIGNTGYDPLTEEAMIRKFVSLSPVGLIIAGVDQTETSRNMLETVDCPVVQIMDSTDDPVDVIVGFSNFEAAAASAQHMVDQGYRRIAFVGTRMDPRTQQRMAGFESVMRQHQIYDPALFITTPQKSSVEIGRHLLAGLLDKVPDCDGVFCNNDDVAVGIGLECQRRNLSVPKDFGICGFNDLGTTSQMNPAITSVYTPRVEIGERAAQYILDRAAGGPQPDIRNIDLGFTLKKRASTLRSEAI